MGNPSVNWRIYANVTALDHPRKLDDRIVNYFAAQEELLGLFKCTGSFHVDIIAS